jgi:hypothetical protein
MTLPSLRPPRRATAARRAAGPLALAAGVLLLYCFCPGLFAAGAPAGEAADRDLRHTLLARKALLKDPALAPLNLGVRVQNRVAVLWGPVPSALMKERAVRALRKLAYLLEVRDELQVEDLPEVAPKYLPERIPPAAPAPAVLPGFSRADQTGRGALTRRLADAPGFTSPAENVRLKPALPALPAADGPPATGAPPDLAVARLLRGDARYRGLQAQLLGSHVYLSGTVARWQDAYDLAGALAALPGVERVVLDQIRAAPGAH